MTLDETRRAFDALRQETNSALDALIIDLETRYPHAWPTQEPEDDTVPPNERPPAVWISQEATHMGSRAEYPTPEDVAVGGLGALLDRLDTRVRFPVGVVLLADQLPTMLGLAADKPRPPAKPGRAVPDARTHGWEISYDEDGRERPWMIARRGNRTLAVGVLPWLPPSKFPLQHEDVPHMLWRMERWTALLGEPYYGEGAGLCGIALIREHTVTSKTKRENRPFWLPDWTGCRPAGQGGTERPDNWTSAFPHEQRFEHQYDVTTQHLSAAQVVELAPGGLRRHVDAYVPTLKNPAGYYLITVPKLWDLTGRLPHPAGGKTLEDRAWVTAPTLNLLAECAETHSLMDLPEVHDRWVSHLPPEKGGGVHPGTRVLRKFGDTVAAAVKGAHAMALVNADEAVMVRTVKDVYKWTRGMLERPGGRIHRPDWAHAITAQARVNLWRKIYTEGMTSGRWPVRVDADACWYASDNPDPVAAAPETFKLGDGATGGTFTIKGTKEVAR